MKKNMLSAAVVIMALVLTVVSCSRRKNIIPVGPGELFTATSSPAISTATRTVTGTNTPVPPTFTRTNTVLVPSMTFTASYTLTRTNTPVPPTSTRTNTVIIPSSTFTHSMTASPTMTITYNLSPSFTATDSPVYSPTNTPSVTPTFTDSPVYSPTDTPTITETLTDTPVLPSATGTATFTFTRTGTATFTRTNTVPLTLSRTSTSTRTNTPLIPTATQTPVATVPLALIIYDGDTAGSRLADGAVTNGAPGSMTEVTGGNPGNLMRNTFVIPAGNWQQQEWHPTNAAIIGANTYLLFNVRMAPGSPNAITNFRITINWTRGHVAVAPYLLEGGAIDGSWKTAKIPLADIIGAGQTQIDYLVFISNFAGNYTVDVDNVRLEGSVPSATPTRTNTVNPLWTKTNTPTISPTSTPYTGFLHPGAWSTKAELDFVKARIAANAQPWTQQLSYLIGSASGASSGVNFNGVIQNSCTQEGAVQTDSALVYANALAWYLTGTTSYYTKAMNILANYAGLLGFQSTGCFSGQSILDASWFGVLFANACELLRTSPSWTPANTTAYTNMFKTAFYPKLNTMSPDNGNIDLTQIDAMFSMAVFCDDQAEWNLAVSRYQARMPAAFIDSNWTGVPGTGKPAALGNFNTNNCGGASSPPVDFWYCPTSWPGGLQQETCRDLGHHTQFALDAAVDCAEIDYHQGSPAALYSTYQTMLRPALELLARQFVTVSTCGTCSGTWPAGQQKLDMFEAGFNHYANRNGAAYGVAGDPLYYTNQWINTLRASGGTTWLQFNIAYEALTHAGVY